MMVIKLNSPISIFVSLIIVGTNGELRFCHHGPQRVDGRECPYGIFFKNPITSKCLYYYKNENSSKAPVYSPDVCGADSITLGENIKIGPTVLQRIVYNENRTEVLEILDARSNPSCIQECFDEVELSKFSRADENLHEYSFREVSCSNAINQEQANISEKLFDYLLFGQHSESKLQGFRVHELFETVVLIFAKHCGGAYIKSEFLIQAHEALKYLHFQINKQKVKEVPFPAADSIQKYLKDCLNYPKTNMYLTGTQCSTKAKIEWMEFVKPHSVERRRVKYRIEPKSWRYGKYDIFIEAMWAALDFTHSVCFEHFREDPLHFDMFTDYLTHIFSFREIKERWYCPHKLKNEQFWNNLAGVADVNWTMRNIDFCAQAAAAASIFKYRLDRPFQTQDDTTDAILLKATVPTSTGWTESEEAYWMVYDRLGGIQNHLKATDDGFCPTNPEDVEHFKEQESITCEKQLTTTDTQ